MRIAICGGTFDPIHRGHVEPVLESRPIFGWDRVVYVPAFRQPFKENAQTASPVHRHAMTVLATSGLEGFEVSRIELDRDEISYTVETLRKFRSELGPEVTVDWIIGDDNLAQLAEWRSIDEVLMLTNFVVLTRGTGTLTTEFENRVERAPGHQTAGSILFAQNDTIEISSTTIRELIEREEPFEDLVHPAVARYIHSHRLYRRGNH